LGSVDKEPGASTGVAGWLRHKLAHPLASGLDLESAEATRVHARLIREKPFLRRLYGQYYAAYDAAIRRATPGGLIIEVGSGGGFYPTIRRNVISLDMRPGADVDVVASALAMPFPAASASAVLLLNVLHHLPDPMAFFRECTRILKPGGRVCLIEPYVSVLSRRLVKPLHHEPWDETAGCASRSGRDRREHGNAVDHLIAVWRALRRGIADLRSIASASTRSASICCRAECRCARSCLDGSSVRYGRPSACWRPPRERSPR
jgi:SAM-dependent methyltransferase